MICVAVCKRLQTATNGYKRFKEWYINELHFYA